MDGIYNALKMEEITDQYDAAEMDNQKGLAIVALIFEILFFLPVVSNKESAYAKEMSNQVLTICIANLANSIILSRILGLIPVVGGLVSNLISIALFVICVLKIVDACQGKFRKLPFGFSINVFK